MEIFTFQTTFLFIINSNCILAEKISDWFFFTNQTIYSILNSPFMEHDPEKTASFFRFEDLRIYLKSLEYIDWVYRKTSKFPENGPATLAAHFNNSAITIALQIAEGSARNKAQFIHFLKIAKSSVRECVVHTTLATRQKYLTDAEADESRNQLMEMTKMLGALIGSLQRSAGIVDSDND